MEFINREREIKYLTNHFKSEPNCLLFVYGPKSSGKSALLEKVAGELDKDKYAVNFLDLRQVIVYDFKTFLDVFFQEDIKDKGKDILSGLTIKAGFFNVNFNERAFLKKNAFGLMVQKLQSANDRGVRPVIIIDEIQLLKNIGLNGERYLIDELFNLFIAITKVKHLAHVVLATSDSYFIEDIYNSARLAMTSKFFLLGHFKKETVYEWLENEDFKDREMDEVWDSVGGCPWELRQIIEDRRQGAGIREIIQELFDNSYGRLFEFKRNLGGEEKETFNRVVKQIVNNGFFEIGDEDDGEQLDGLLKKCIEMDIWFYTAHNHKITANSKSVWHSFRRMV